MNKHIETALKEINFAIEWETQEKQDQVIKETLERIFYAGQLYQINAKKHERLL